MKRVLHALAALWLGRPKTGDRLMTEDRSRETEEDRSWETEDRWKTEERRREHEGPWLPEARNGLLRHLHAIMRMGETVRELAIRECAKEQPSESANVQTNESAPKKTDDHLPKRVIVSEREQPAERIGEPLPIAQVLARLYLRHAPRCAMGDATQPCAIANPRIGESATQQINAPRHHRSPVALTAFIFAVFMCLLSAQQVSAQAEPAAAAVIQPLQIGETIPEELWHMPLQVVNQPPAGGKETITLNDYRGKLIILDFWATFCGSCIAAMPKIAEVQRQFIDDMVVIPISWSMPDATEQALQTHSILAPLALSSVVDAKIMIDAFPHGVVPHYAWIDPQGRIVATTASNDVTHANIARVLEGEEPDYVLKTFIDADKPLLFASDKLPSGVEVQQYSVFIRGEIPSLGGGTTTRTTDGNVHGYAMQNRTIINMYQIIASKIKGDSIPVMGGIGTKRFRVLDKIDDKAKCTFDFVLSPKNTDSLYQYMLATLNQHSGYTGRWVRRKLPCLVLVKLGSAGTFISKAPDRDSRLDSAMYSLTKSPIDRLVSRLSREDISGTRIVINETGYEGNIDISLHAPFDDLEHVRRQLRTYGLDLRATRREVEVFELTKT